MMATAAVFWGRQRLDADGADADPRRRAEAEVADSVLKQWAALQISAEISPRDIDEILYRRRQNDEIPEGLV